jgi:hypothetical protein
MAVLRQLEHRVRDLKARLKVEGRSPTKMTWDDVRQDPGPTRLSPEWSAVPTGREVCLEIQILEDEEPSASRRERALAMLWGLVVPLGFTPFNRYPLPGPCESVFHFFGPWASMMDQLLGAGRGEAAWPSFCCAAQIDVGRWEGSRTTERLVQAHLHRLGYNVGPVDGIVGNKTQGALRAANLHSQSMTEVAEQIVKLSAKSTRTFESAVQGRLELPDVNFSIHSYGQVRASRTIQGADLHGTGPGRVVLDIREPT